MLKRNCNYKMLAYLSIITTHCYVVAMYMPVLYFRHGTTACADSAISGVKTLYHAAKNAISVSVYYGTVNLLQLTSYLTGYKDFTGCLF